jgi:NADH-quinone oxidoreductase subunit A
MAFVAVSGRIFPCPDQQEERPLPEQYFPVLLALGVSIALGAIILIASHLLSLFVGNQRGGLIKGTTVESGMPLMDISHKRISIAFFLVAIDFIVFDLEAAFLYPWSLILRDGGWYLFGAVMVFIFMILVGYAYVWLKGGLDLSLPARERRPVRLTS